MVTVNRALVFVDGELHMDIGHMPSATIYPIGSIAYIHIHGQWLWCVLSEQTIEGVFTTRKVPPAWISELTEKIPPKLQMLALLHT